MKIQGGYGRKAIKHNVQEYIDEGYPHDKARAMAIKIARKFFYKVKPGEDLPDYLQEE